MCECESERLAALQQTCLVLMCSLLSYLHDFFMHLFSFLLSGLYDIKELVSYELRGLNKARCNINSEISTMVSL